MGIVVSAHFDIGVPPMRGRKRLGGVKTSKILPSRVVSPEPYTYINPKDLPSSFDWRSNQGKVFVCSF